MATTNYERMRQNLMAKLPSINEVVTITLDNSKSPMKTGPYASHVPETVDIVGKLVVKDRRIDNDPSNFALFVEGSPVRLRIINIFSVVAINGIAMFSKQGRMERIRSNRKTFRVAGSQGATYTVTLDGGRWSCNCPGYTYRKNCRHVKEAKENDNG